MINKEALQTIFTCLDRGTGTNALIPFEPYAEPIGTNRFPDLKFLVMVHLVAPGVMSIDVKLPDWLRAKHLANFTICKSPIDNHDVITRTVFEEQCILNTEALDPRLKIKGQDVHDLTKDCLLFVYEIEREIVRHCYRAFVS